MVRHKVYCWHPDMDELPNKHHDLDFDAALAIGADLSHVTSSAIPALRSKLNEVIDRLNEVCAVLRQP